ncbi:MAG TPA: SDR family oxidoreductase [Candidatus Angelobacter sp.]|jgi:long-chain acyl-CoA synthetase|nr:SDR family oxidoreductase [Candidatus Angelobacter sp.]
MSRGVLLLTGATGLVGGELLRACLDRRPDRRIAILVRNKGKVSHLERCEQITVLEGDMTRAGLGLDSSILGTIQREVTEILHCAAETRFGLPIEEVRATNTRGTSNLLQVAQGCRNLEKLVCLSTAYVAGRMTGRIPEAELRHHKGFVNTYQQSKYEAEHLVLEAMANIPTVIYRLSTIIGDSRTGEVTQFNYFHRILRLLAKNVLPVVPGHPTWQVDLIPLDWACAALSALFEFHFVPGQIVHVCGGSGGSPIIAEIRDTAAELFEKHPLVRKWLPLKMPELVSLSKYEEYVQESLRSGDKILVELLKVLNTFLPQMGIEQSFDDHYLIRALDGSGIHLPPFRDYYGKVITYCLETDWGRKTAKSQAIRQRET